MHVPKWGKLKLSQGLCQLGSSNHHKKFSNRMIFIFFMCSKLWWKFYISLNYHILGSLQCIVEDLYQKNNKPRLENFPDSFTWFTNFSIILKHTFEDSPIWEFNDKNLHSCNYICLSFMLAENEEEDGIINFSTSAQIAFIGKGNF